MKRPCLLLVLVLGTSGAIAQTISEPLRSAEIVSEATEIDAKRTGRARFFDPQDGQLDLSYFLENPRGFLPIPIVVTEPAVGYGAGGAGMFLRPRREAGDEGWARPDISAVGAFATENGTWGAFGGDASRWFEGRLRTLVGAGAGQFNLDFYGRGSGPSSLNESVRYSLQFTGAVAQANWQLAPKSPWAVGVRYVHADVDPKPAHDIFQGLADRARVTISAPTAIARVRYTRQPVHADPWSVCESSWLASRETLGASDDFERFQQVLIGWHPACRMT
jgi:hypothetical protein